MNCENLLSCHITFSMNTHKQTLKSFSLTSTKTWAGGRVGYGGWRGRGGCRSERLCSEVLNPSFHVYHGFFSFKKKKKIQTSVKQLRQDSR